MNKLFRFFILCFIGLLPFAAQAQNLRNNPNLQARVTQAKLVEIKNALDLSDAKMSELAPVYKRYEAEINEINFARQGRLMGTNPDSLSADDADKLITSHLDNAIKISTIRRKYYNEFKTILTPQQVMKLYKSEAQLNKKVMQELRRRLRNRAGQ
ncbi:Spy/CpxP family protein refolding chaperone [Pontibacter aydingkolensis]|uniref:DUF4142 domain-containing protein n=1 Tax=Pontibacter aydingkolensis TaxID=1911536 RepID=A0ABS7CTW1_9BACT|nr:hypothetical protein [Pontibacter aydingkolensis]MBW7467304.1 hypothetical protein [Pontibacter aydingkolensis]